MEGGKEEMCESERNLMNSKYIKYIKDLWKPSAESLR